MNLSPTLSRPRRSILAGLLLVSAASLLIGWTAGSVAASSGAQPSPTTAATANQNSLGGAELGVPTTGQVSTEPGVASGSSGAAVAYPYQIYPSLGVAPENTILAAGTGTADMKADGSDRATAMAKATALALADAKAQAQAMATAMGVSITGTYSVSISSSDSYVYPTSDCALPMPLEPATGTSGSSQGTTTITPVPAGSPEVCAPGTAVSPTSMQLVVTVIVAYRFA
ncbi:MAG: SIMPL domain-containing protein [Candidatus Limnocylindrales bacterium]|jgi:hypothetical protein